MKTPFVGLNTVRGIGGQRALFIAVLEVGDAYLGVEHQIGINQVVVCVAKTENFPRFYIAAPESLAQVVADLKRTALERGATLEAIQLLGTLTPLTKKEETTMVNPKLAKKPAAVAPVPDPKAGKPKGDKGAALAAARAAKSSANDAKKIKVIKKDHGARAGTNRANMLDIVLASKTVGEAKEAGAGWIDVKHAESQGLISLS